MLDEIVLPRSTPDRDSRYMGMAWITASFSKDPSTQVGAKIVTQDNEPLGSGYNGPARCVPDKCAPWHRPPKDDPNAFSKYDVVIHAEANALDWSNPAKLPGAIIYVTAPPCPVCIKEISRKQLSKVVYWNYRGGGGMVSKADEWLPKTLEYAKLAGIYMVEFQGNIDWVADWTEHLKSLGILKPSV